MAREWSRYQSAIFDHVEHGSDDGVVIARAGSGKTTVLEESVRRLPRGQSTIVLAFNNAIAKELATRIPCAAYSMTTHVYGRTLLERRFEGIALVKTKVRDLMAERYVRLNPGMFAAVIKGVSLAKNTLATTPEEIDALIDAYGIDLWPRERPQFVEMVSDMLRACVECTHAMDFDDMLYMPVAHDLRPAGFDNLLVDEVQDLNRCQVELCLRGVKESGRILGVGDDRQAIYAFRGADPKAVPRLIDTLGAVTLPLSITYRCAKAIVRVANQIVPDLEAAPDAPEGVVRDVRKSDVLREARPGDFILSRTNAPLVEMTMALLGEGRPAKMLGRDIGDGLLKLVSKSHAETVNDLVKYVDDWAEKQAARLLRRGGNPEPPRDQAECVARIAEGASSVAEVERKIRSLFDDDVDDSERIVLSSTHKAKGLERERVWMLAATYRKRPGVEEDNLFYVAVTRAKRELMMVA